MVKEVAILETKELSLQWACSEASKCLFCVDAPCIDACPANIDIPLFVRLIRFKDLTGAKKIIKKENRLGGICAYLCPSSELCEKACLKQKIDEPVKIAALQQYACDNADYTFEYDISNSTNGNVAIIGAGPAGLSCADSLLRSGYKVDIYEKENYIGGTVVKEIPYFKIPAEAVNKDLSEFNFEKNENINLFFSQEINHLNLFSKLIDDYDAVFISMGLDVERNLDADEVTGTYTASRFLSLIQEGEITELKGISIVIGGGDTAIDASRAALKLGADRSIVAYRRSKVEMPANEDDYLKAVKEGVEFMFYVSPSEIKQDNSSIQVKFVRNVLVETDSTGRKGFKELPGSEFYINASRVIYALGKRNHNVIWENLYAKINQNISQEKLQLGDSKVFVGGDFLNNGKTVVEAVENGKRAAKSIDWYLRNQH